MKRKSSCLFLFFYAAIRIVAVMEVRHPIVKSTAPAMETAESDSRSNSPDCTIIPDERDYSGGE